MYSGLIIKESIADEQVLDLVDIVKVEIWKTENNPRYWTALSFTSDYENFPVLLSKALERSSKSGMIWYVDICDNLFKYIVLRNNVLKYHLDNAEEKKKVCRKCMELGIKEEQLDWSD